MNKRLSLVFAFCAALFLLAACGGNTAPAPPDDTYEAASTPPPAVEYEPIAPERSFPARLYFGSSEWGMSREDIVQIYGAADIERVASAPPVPQLVFENTTAHGFEARAVFWLDNSGELFQGSYSVDADNFEGLLLRLIDVYGPYDDYEHIERTVAGLNHDSVSYSWERNGTRLSLSLNNFGGSASVMSFEYACLVRLDRLSAHLDKNPLLQHSIVGVSERIGIIDMPRNEFMAATPADFVEFKAMYLDPQNRIYRWVVFDFGDGRGVFVGFDIAYGELTENRDNIMANIYTEYEAVTFMAFYADGEYVFWVPCDIEGASIHSDLSGIIP